MAQVIFDFNGLEIVGVFGRNIYVKTRMSIFDEENEIDTSYVWGCLEFSMTTWVELQKNWIQEKRKYCERHDYFCGYGSIISTAKNIGVIDLFIDDSDDTVFVPLYKPLKFSVDMEHG